MKKLNQINHPIFAISNDSNLIAKEKGLFSFCFEIKYSCLYGKNIQEFESLRILNNRLIDIVGENFIIQKTDFFFKDIYQDDLMSESFIEEMNHSHFIGRERKTQKSFITFTCLPEKYLKYDSTKTNRFLIKEKGGNIFEPVIDKNYISADNLDLYQRKKEQIINVLTSKSNTLFQARLLTGEQDFENAFKLWENLSSDENSSDVTIENGVIQIGQKKYRTYSIDNLEDLPDFLPEYSIAYEKSDETMPIPKSILSPLGLELDGNHILNQYFYIPPQEDYMKELKKQQNRLGNFSDFFDKAKGTKTGTKSSEEEDNDIYADQLKNFRKELRETSQKIILTHVNLIAEELDIKDANFQLKLKENLVDIIDIYFASCLGNAIGLPTDLYMPLTQEQAFSFFYCENYNLGVLKGMRIVCPISGNPIKMDFFRTLKANKDIQNYNSWGVGESGSGKSFTFNKILMYQFLEGDHVFNIDGSSSFERATDFVRKISNGRHGFFMKISSSTKIGMNPFLKLDGEKIESKVVFLSQMILNILDLEEKKENSFIDTLLKLILKEYYLKNNEEFNFNSFYDFFKKEADVIIENEGMSGVILPNQILFLLRDYYRGGSYEFLLNNSDERLKDLKGNRYITFQVKELKDNPKLFSIVTFLLTNLYKEKLYELDFLDRIKFIHYDEVWTAMDKPVLVHFIKDTIKTVRSQNGATIFTSQEPEDFFENEIIKNAVINNSELGFITNLQKYRGKLNYVRELLSLTETQASVIFSLNQKRHPKYNFREFACLVGRKRIDVFGMEVSLEEKAIYESDADEKIILNKIDKENFYNPLITAKSYAEMIRKEQNQK